MYAVNIFEERLLLLPCDAAAPGVPVAQLPAAVVAAVVSKLTVHRLPLLRSTH
jgi:hypothetical protein